jgi:hypothetical protein
MARGVGMPDAGKVMQVMPHHSPSLSSPRWYRIVAFWGSVTVMPYHSPSLSPPSELHCSPFGGAAGSLVMYGPGPLSLDGLEMTMWWEVQGEQAWLKGRG